MSNVISLPVTNARTKTELHIKLDKPLNIPMPKSTRPTFIGQCRWFFRKHIMPQVRRIQAIRSRYLLGKLTALALKLNRKDFQVVVKYDGTDNFFCCFVFCGGEKGAVEPSMRFSGSHHLQDYNYNLNPKKIKEAIAGVKAMSRHNQLIRPILPPLS